MSRHFDDWYFGSGSYLLEMPDRWQPLKDYPGYYICEEGFVINSDGKILPYHKGDRAGHINVRLRKNHKSKEEYLHRLLAKQYISNPNNYPVVRHLDDDVYNNSLDNLAWGTQKDNHKDSVRNGTYKPFTDEMREIHLRVQRTPVIATNLRTGEELYFRSQADAAKELGVHQANMYKVLNGERYQTCGYHFRYAKGDR